MSMKGLIMCVCVLPHQSLPEGERDRILTEEKLGGSKLGMGVAGSPHRTKALTAKVRLLPLGFRLNPFMELVW